MTKRFHIKKGDTRPSIRAVLQDSMGQPRNLKGAEYIRFNMVHEDGDVAVDEGEGSIISEEDGEVAYAWEDGDTDLVGEHSAEFEIEYTDGGVESFPNNDNIIVTIHENIA